MYIPRRTKKAPSDRTICPVCKGAKVVQVKKGTEVKEIPCPRCGGRGYI